MDLIENCPLLPIQMFQPPWPTGAQQENQPERNVKQRCEHSGKRREGLHFPKQRVRLSKWERLQELWPRPRKADHAARIVQGLRGRGGGVGGPAVRTLRALEKPSTERVCP